MKLTSPPITLTAFAVVAALAVGGMTGCGNSASGENSAAVGTLASTTGSTDLSGTWVLNKDLSDHPRRPDSLHHSDSTDRPMGWRRPGGRGGRGPHPDSLQEGRHPRGPMTFVIEQTDSTVAITGPRNRTRTLYTDGRVITHQRDDDKVGQVTASWSSEGQLVVTRTGPHGGTHTETFSLASDGQQLIIATHIDPTNDREPRDFLRVFDAAPSGN